MVCQAYSTMNKALGLEDKLCKLLETYCFDLSNLFTPHITSLSFYIPLPLLLPSHYLHSYLCPPFLSFPSSLWLLSSAVPLSISLLTHSLSALLCFPLSTHTHSPFPSCPPSLFSHPLAIISSFSSSFPILLFLIPTRPITPPSISLSLYRPSPLLPLSLPLPFPFPNPSLSKHHSQLSGLSPVPFRTFPLLQPTPFSCSIPHSPSPHLLPLL